MDVVKKVWSSGIGMARAGLSDAEKTETQRVDSHELIEGAQKNETRDREIRGATHIRMTHAKAPRRNGMGNGEWE